MIVFVSIITIIRIISHFEPLASWKLPAFIVMDSIMQGRLNANGVLCCLEQKKENGYDMMIEARSDGQFYIASIIIEKDFYIFQV